MSNSSKVINTPIKLNLVDNRIFFLDSEIGKVMESNGYRVEIYTEEILDKCNLAMKRYGNNELIKIGSYLEFEVIRLIKVIGVINNSPFEYWGILRKDLNNENNLYLADLYKYNFIEVDDIIPEKKKKEEVITEIIGQIKGNFEEKSDSDEDYIFTPTSIKINDLSAPELAYVGVSEEGKFIFKTGDVELKTQIIISKNFSEIPNPPMIDASLVPPEKLTISKDLEISDENNDFLNNMILSFINFEMDFSSYNENYREFYFNKEIEIAENNLIYFDQEGSESENTLEGENTDPSEPNVDEKIVIVAQYNENLKFKKEILSSELGKYKSCFGKFLVNLKISKDNLSKYELSVDFVLNLNAEGLVPKVDENENYLYYLPEKEYIYEDIQAVERDGTGDILTTEELVYLYETNLANEPIRDAQGNKIPIYEREIIINDNGEEEEVIKLNEEGYAQPKIKLDPITNLPVTEQVNQIEYRRGVNGELVYEFVLVPIYKRDENTGKIIIEEYNPSDADSVSESPIIIDYERDKNGNYIYEKRLVPIYVVDGNNEIVKDENGYPEVVYKRDGTGEIILDENGQPVLAYEKDMYGDYILDSENERFPIFEKEIIINDNGEEEEVIKRRIVGWTLKKDINGNIIYVSIPKEKIEEIPNVEINLDNTDPTLDSGSGNEEDDDIVEESEIPEAEPETPEEEPESPEEPEESEIPDEEPEKPKEELELKVFTSNFLPKYEKENINGKDYYKLDENGEFIIVYEKDENDNNVISYDRDIDGNKIIIENYIQLLTDGEVQQKIETNIVDISNTKISYENFSYTQEEVDKDLFIPEESDNNIYTSIIKAEYIPAGTEKFLLGVVKYDTNDKIEYATDAVEFLVERSIETITWNPIEDFLNEKVVIANYDNEKNSYYELSTSLETAIYLEGRENYIYIDLTENNIEGSNISVAVRKWNPKDGFYKLELASKKNI